MMVVDFLLFSCTEPPRTSCSVPQPQRPSQLTDSDTTPRSTSFFRILLPRSIHHGIVILEGEGNLSRSEGETLRRHGGQHRHRICDGAGARQDGWEGHPRLPQRRAWPRGGRKAQEGGFGEARRRGHRSAGRAGKSGRATRDPRPRLSAVDHLLRPEIQGRRDQGGRPHQQRGHHGHPRTTGDRRRLRAADRCQPLRRPPADEAHGADDQGGRARHLFVLHRAPTASGSVQDHPRLRQRELRAAEHVQQLDGVRPVQAREHPRRKGVRGPARVSQHLHVRLPAGRGQHGALAQHDGQQLHLARDAVERAVDQVRPVDPPHGGADLPAVRGGPRAGGAGVHGQVLGEDGGGDALGAGEGPRDGTPHVGRDGVHAGGEARQEGGRSSFLTSFARFPSIPSGNETSFFFVWRGSSRAFSERWFALPLIL